MLTVFNQGGGIVITPTASDTPDLDVTIEGVTYSETWDTDAATTIAAWIVSHGQTVSDRFGIAAIIASSTLVLSGVSSAAISTGASNPITASASQAYVDTAAITSISLTNSKVAACTVGSATLTLTFVSASDLLKGVDELGRLSNASDKAAGITTFQTAARGVLS